MLGNWSFGRYFKVCIPFQLTGVYADRSAPTQKEATTYAWKLLTEVYGLPAERLYVSYFEGGFGIDADLETKQFWLDLGVKEDHMIKGNAADNFWGTCDYF